MMSSRPLAQTARASDYAGPSDALATSITWTRPYPGHVLLPLYLLWY